MDSSIGTRSAMVAWLVATSLLLTPAAAVDHLDQEARGTAPGSCGGTAPTDFWCTLDGQGVQVQWGADYTGILESVIAHDAGERRFWCTVDGGNLMGCEFEGSYPPVGSAVTVECWSLWERTGGIPWLKTGMDGTPQTTPGGIPGGMGDWSCTAAE